MKGYEILFETIRHQLNCHWDLVVSAFHCYLINILGFKIVDIGVEPSFKPEYETKSGTELLPNGWNSYTSTNPTYKLVYRLSSELQGSKFLYMKCLADGNDRMIVTLSSLNKDSDEAELFGTFTVRKSDYFPENLNFNQESIFEKFKNSDKLDRLAKLLEEIVLGKTNTNKTRSSLLEDNPIPMNPSHNPIPLSSNNNPSSEFPFPQIGGADLDPFGRGQGGMLFNPFSGNRLRPEMGPPRMNFPRDSLPPGARYDPVGPLPDARFYRPTPDHLPPPRGPGFDDFFM